MACKGHRAVRFSGRLLYFGSCCAGLHSFHSLYSRRYWAFAYGSRCDGGPIFPENDSFHVLVDWRPFIHRMPIAQTLDLSNM